MDQLIQLLDGIKLPFELPLLLHGPVVHFAIAIPVIALLLEISNLAIRRRCVGVISGLLITLAGLVYLAAFFTGKTDGSEAYSLLSAEGKEELKEHKLLGIYLVYGIWLVLLLKLIFMAIQRFWAKVLFTLILAGFVAASFIQGKHGGELAYKYGANVKAVSDMDDKVMELEDEIDTLKEKCKEQPTKVEAPAKVKKEEPKTQPAVQPAPVKEEPQAKPHEQTAPAAEQNSSATEAPSTIEQKAQEALEQIKAKSEEVLQKVEKTTSHQTPAAPQESNEATHEPAH